MEVSAIKVSTPPLCHAVSAYFRVMISASITESAFSKHQHVTASAWMVILVFTSFVIHTTAVFVLRANGLFGLSYSRTWFFSFSVILVLVIISDSFRLRFFLLGGRLWFLLGSRI